MNQSLEAILRRLAKEWGADEEMTLKRVRLVRKLSLELKYRETAVEPAKAKLFDQASLAVLVRALSGRKTLVIFSKSYLDKDRVRRAAICVVDADPSMVRWIEGKTLVAPSSFVTVHGWVRPAPTLDELDRPDPISERRAQKGLEEANRPPRR